MAADPPPAEFEVSIIIPGVGLQNIYACSLHLAHTIRTLRKDTGIRVAVGDADPGLHGCKGHLDDWPVS